MSAFELITTALFAIVLILVLVVLPVVALRRQAPRGPEEFVQRSDHPMPDRNYLGQGLGGE
jgi:hypothetical protein